MLSRTLKLLAIFVLGLVTMVPSGFATLGKICFEGRRDYGAIGNVTILASRLSSKAQGGKILTDQRTLVKIEKLIEAEPLGQMQLKGFTRPFSTYNISKLK